MDSDSSTSAVEAAEDGLVRILPDALADKIAAGEVVQRPASVVKELVENALDSGATEVVLHVRGAGSDLIQVIDDGCGMGAADAVACFGRHATSKLRSFEDLETLFTLGFRGEALASIGAVAQVELRTKRVQDRHGALVRYDGGKLREKAPSAAPEGTSVAVRNLFYNVPARRSFMKSPATEFRHIVETFQVLALSHPRVGFTLTHDGNEMYRLAPSTSERLSALSERITELFGERAGERLIQVSESTSYLSLTGWLGQPEQAKRTRPDSYLFVNGRFIRNRSLDHAISSAYGDLIEKSATPFSVLFLDVDPRHVDANVHPTKTEVKFDDERGVYGFVRAVVRRAVGEAGLIPAHEAEAGGGVQGAHLGAVFGRPHASTDASTQSPKSETPFTPRREPMRIEAGFSTPGASFDMDLSSEPAAENQSAADDARPSELLWSAELPVWQLHQRYVLAPIRSGLLMVDQQAAHERILYERYLGHLGGEQRASQQLLFPHTIEFDPTRYTLVQQILPDLQALGFELDTLSGRTVLVRGIPIDVRAGDEHAVLDDVLVQYEALGAAPGVTRRERLAAALARRNAFRPGHKLQSAEMQLLIDQLFSCQEPHFSPSGRATTVRVSIDDIDRLFSRR